MYIYFFLYYLFFNLCLLLGSCTKSSKNKQGSYVKKTHISPPFVFSFFFVCLLLGLSVSTPPAPEPYKYGQQ